MNLLFTGGGLWGAIVFTVWLMMVRARKIMISRHHIEPCEMFNMLYALAVIVPLTIYDNYLISSPYLAHLAHVASRTTVLWIFSCLFTYWSICLLFGGVPSGFINNEGQLSLWGKARIAGLFAGLMTWGTMAYLTSQPHISGGTVLFGGQAIFCISVSIVLAWDVSVERQARAERARRQRLIESSAAAPTTTSTIIKTGSVPPVSV